VVGVVRGGKMSGLWQIRAKYDASDPSNLVFNMYGYRSFLAHAGNEAEDLANAWINQVNPLVMDVLSTNTFFIGVEVIEMNDPTKFAAVNATVVTAGTRTGDPMPRFVAWKYQLTRAVRGERHGYKRYGAISEADVTAGLPNAGVLGPLDDLRVQLKEPLTFGAVQVWFPVILHRPTPPSTVWDSHEFTAAQVQNVTTQNTRKR